MKDKRLLKITTYAGPYDNPRDLRGWTDSYLPSNPFLFGVWSFSASNQEVDDAFGVAEAVHGLLSKGVTRVELEANGHTICVEVL